MQFLMKVLCLCLLFLQLDVFAGCSPYIGRATLNEAFHKPSGGVVAHLEVKRVGLSLTDADYDSWSMVICAGSVCNSMTLSALDDSSSSWIVADYANGDFTRNLIDFDNGFSWALLDENDHMIDYLEVNGYSDSALPQTCSNFSYPTNTPATINGTKLLNRKPGGTGTWDAEAGNPTETPGASNEQITVDSCATFFPGGLQTNTNSNSYRIYFNQGAKLYGNPTHELVTKAPIGSNASGTCVGFANECTNTGNFVPMIDYDIFNSESTKTINNQVITIGPGYYKSITLQSADVTFTEGDYYIDGDLKVNSSDIKVPTGMVVRVFAEGGVDLGGKSSINVTGSAENFLLYSKGSEVKIDNGEINAFIYSKQHVSPNNGSVVRGAITARSINLGSNSKVFFDGTPNFGDFCDSTPPPPPSPPILLSEYRFDEAHWSGLSGEVIDETSNDLDGHAAGDSNTITAGQVCRAGTFDGNGDYIGVTDFPVNLSTTASLSFWLKTRQTGGWAKFAPGITGFFSESNTANNILWGFIDTSGRIGIKKGTGSAAKSTNPVNDGKWHHIVLTRNSSTGAAQVFVDGGALNVGVGNQKSAYSDSGDVATPFSSIGRIEHAPVANSKYFNGELDEVLVFDSVIADSDVLTIYENQLAGRNYDGSARVCPGGTTVDHFEIVHDGEGLTCEPETVTINACANSNCTSKDNGSYAITLNVDGMAEQSFTLNETATVSISHNIAETVVFSLNDPNFVCTNGVSNSCDMAFYDSRFTFSTIEDQVAGVAFDGITLTGIADVGGVCTSILSGDVDIDFAMEYQDPDTPSALAYTIQEAEKPGTPAIPGAVIDIAKNLNSSALTYSNVKVDFASTGAGTLENNIYHNAGQIKLYARKVIPASNGVSGYTIEGSSNAFWVSPHHFNVAAYNSVPSLLNGTAANSTEKHVAGDSFTLKISAENLGGYTTTNYDAKLGELKLIRTAPLSGSASADGELTYGIASNITSDGSLVHDASLVFSQGEYEYSAAEYSEVGLIQLSYQDIAYGTIPGAYIPTGTGDIGRFTPDYFTLEVTNDGELLSVCNSVAPSVPFAYSGQREMLDANTGAISYLTAPLLTITAYNSDGIITQNYTNDSADGALDYQKLTPKKIHNKINKPTTDAVAVGVDSSLLPVVADMADKGILHRTDQNNVSSPSLPNGVMQYQFPLTDNFYYLRSANALVAPFTAALNFVIKRFKDSDNIKSESASSVQPVGLPIRFGRLVIDNSYGPETADLPLTLHSQYWSGSAYVENTDDSCTPYNVTPTANGTLGNTGLNPALDPTKTSSVGVDTLIRGENIMLLTKPSDGSQGQVRYTYEKTPIWLQFDWNSDGNYNNNAAGIGAFGLFRGNDRIISWREK